MPKLNLDKDFVARLNNINLSKSTTNLKTLEDNPKSKFKISEDTSPFMPEIKIPKKKPVEKFIFNQSSSSSSSSSSSRLLKEMNNKMLDSLVTKINNLERLMVSNITDTNAMWNSFDDNIKKIVLSEIINKYYMYKLWKINSGSFILGFLTAIILIMVFIIICVFIF